MEISIIKLHKLFSLVVSQAVLLSILLATLAVMSNAGESIHPQALGEGWMGWVQGIISPFGWSKTIDPHSKVEKLQQENKKLEQEIAKLRHGSATQGLAKRTVPIKPLVEGSKLDANANKLIKQIEAHFANHDRQQPASEKKERTRNVPADNGMHNVKGSHDKDLDSITRGDRNFEDWERIRIEQSHVKHRAEDALREQHLAKEHANSQAREQAEAKKEEIDVEKLKITRKVPEVIDTHIAAGLSISYCQKMVGVGSQDTDAPAEQRESFLRLSSQEQDDIQKYCAQVYFSFT